MGRILKLARMGHPVLREKSHNVISPSDFETQQTITDMLATMENYGLLTGLAAPQVFIPKRIVIFSLPKERSRGTVEEDIPLTIMINPVIDVLDQELISDWESCLSLPSLMGKVPRYKSIRYHYLTPTGEKIMREASFHHARVVQHECDHLDGILFPQRMIDMTSFSFREEAEKYLLKHK